MPDDDPWLERTGQGRIEVAAGWSAPDLATPMPRHPTGSTLDPFDPEAIPGAARPVARALAGYPRIDIRPGAPVTPANLAGADPAGASGPISPLLPPAPEAGVSTAAADFNDPEFAQQTATLGPEGINVLALYDDGYTGAGIRIGVVDVGVDWNDPELVGRVDKTGGWNAITSTSNAYTPPPWPSHGTTVSKAIAGNANNGVGGIGVAHGATIVPFKMTKASIGNRDEQLALLERQVQVDVSNNSWGIQPFADNFLTECAEHGAAIAQAATDGRGGLGTIWIRSGGNNASESGDDINVHNYANNRFTMAVGFADETGAVEAGSTASAALWVVAVGRVSSITAAYASAVAALMLEANPNLGYRDVQTLIALSARPAGTVETPTVNGAAGYLNGGGIGTTRAAGFGLLDATAAVRLAETWEDAPRTEANILHAGAIGTGFAVPDLGAASASVVITEDLLVERAILTLDFGHQRLGDLRVILVSPYGTESALLDRFGNGSAGSISLTFAFSSNQFFWESSAGTWTLRVEDVATGMTGTVRGWSLDLYGAPNGPDDLYVYTDGFAALAASEPARRTLADGDGGVDGLNAAAVSTASTINLAPGGAASLVAGTTLAIAAGTVIEKAWGGSGADTLIGNAAGNTLSGERGDDSLFGGAGRDSVDGGPGADSLNGGPGNDTLEGGPGDDIYLVDSAGDQVVETPEGGADTVRAAVTWTLGAEVEALVLTGTAAISGTGNGLDNGLSGNNAANLLAGAAGNDNLSGQAGKDTLSGESGADVLDGGPGGDSLTGGTGADAFRFGSASEGIDTIADFTRGEDRIWISSAGFGAGILPPGPLDPAFITFGAAATGTNPQLVYNAANGSLSADPDGGGGAAAARFAVLASRPLLDASDFIVVA